MKRDEKNIILYKTCRDECLNNNNKFYAVYFQALILEEIINSNFYLHKKNDMQQNQYLLYSLLNEILGQYDENLFKGIYYEMILSGSQIILTGREENSLKCNMYFSKFNENEYVNGAYQIHLSCILGMAESNIEVAQVYSDNILKLLELRYGIQSWQYAKMKLHIMGEFIYKFEKEVFYSEFRDNYEYFYKYLIGIDPYLCITISLYIYPMLESNDDKFELWLQRLENACKHYKDDYMYNYLMCFAAWIKARAFRLHNQHNSAVELLDETITSFLIPDTINKNLFYGYIYLEAAYNCYFIRDYIKMYEFALAGIEICESFDSKGSELYYNLYDYIGIKYLMDNNLKAAGHLFSSCLPDIIQKFGKESENYIIYMSNLGLIAMREGRNLDIFLGTLLSVRNTKLKKISLSIIRNELCWAKANGMSINSIRRIYNKCIKNLPEDQYKNERIALDTYYFISKIDEHQIDKETISLYNKLNCYHTSIIDEISLLYWNSIKDWKWQEGKIYEASEISRKIMKVINQKEYEKYLLFVMEHIQLLIAIKNYSEAKRLILIMLDIIDKRILDIGFGSIFNFLTIYRIIISMYIYIMKNQSIGFQSDNAETRLLLEKIIRCKSIERETKSLLSQFKGKDVEEDLYLYKQSHRKLAALELRIQERKDRIDIYEKKKIELLWELQELETKLRQKIPFEKLIKQFKFHDINIPETAICVEYFAYYKLASDFSLKILLEDTAEEKDYEYISFILKGSGANAKIQEILSTENFSDEEVIFLLNATEDEGNLSEESIQYFKQLFGIPLSKYIEGKELIYLGTDFILQMLPMDLIFDYHDDEMKNIILVDSACYIEMDVKMNKMDSDALIIGNPKYNINENYQQKKPPLPNAEAECLTIAKMLGATPYIGKTAKQSVLWGGYKKNIIHISTHGEIINVDLSEIPYKNDLFINSYLLLAGYEDWLYNRKNKDYGNGVVTGDDFLFMDLSQTSLIVLSACNSNLGYARTLESCHGLRWSISTAGAQNSITTLWSVDDNVTAVLMIIFYRNLKKMPIGKSLLEAKKCLRTITIGKLKSDSVLWDIAKDYVESYTDNDYRPYSDWRKWAAYVCYHR